MYLVFVGDFMRRIHWSLVFWFFALIFSATIYHGQYNFEQEVCSFARFFPEETAYSYIDIHVFLEKDFNEARRREVLELAGRYMVDIVVCPNNFDPLIYIYTKNLKPSKIISGRPFNEIEMSSIKLEYLPTILTANNSLEKFFVDGAEVIYSGKAYRPIGLIDSEHPYVRGDAKPLVPLSQYEKIGSATWYFSGDNINFLNKMQKVLSKSTGEKLEYFIQENIQIREIIKFSTLDKWGRLFFLAFISSLIFSLLAVNLQIQENKKINYIKYALGANKTSEYKFFFLMIISHFCLATIPAFLFVSIFEWSSKIVSNSVNYFNFSGIAFLSSVIIIVLLISSVMYFLSAFIKSGERL